MQFSKQRGDTRNRAVQSRQQIDEVRPKAEVQRSEQNDGVRPSSVAQQSKQHNDAIPSALVQQLKKNDDVRQSEVVQQSKQNVYVKRNEALQRSKRSNANTCRDINSCTALNRSCRCDDLCHLLGDCCWDASPSKSSSPDYMRKMSCVELAANVFFWVVGDCPDNYDDAEVKQKCVRNQTRGEQDPEIIVPVLERSTTITYFNRFCAECNGAGEVVPYNISVSGFNNGCKRPDTSLPVAVLKHYLQENSSCLIDFVTDNAIRSRRCYTDLISTCPSKNSTLQKSCESGPLNPVFVDLEVLDRRSSTGFRNHDCYECSALYPAPRLLCIPEPSPVIFPFRVLVDTGDLVANNGTKDVYGCSEGQIYDHIHVRYFYTIDFIMGRTFLYI